MGIAENLARVRERIEAACARVGRAGDSVKLLAVSKAQPLEAVVSAFEAGQIAFGENYAQELHEKADAVPEAEWHFIGALQTNKVKLVVGHAELVHTCDRVNLAKELSKRASARGKVQRVLIEVNVGREPQKGGAMPEEVEPLHALVRAGAAARVARAVDGDERGLRGGDRGGLDAGPRRHRNLRRAADARLRTVRVSGHHT